MTLKIYPSQELALAVLTGGPLSFLTVTAVKEIYATYTTSNSQQFIKVVTYIILPILLVLIIHISVFANKVYGVIPAQIGGGRPQNAQLIIEAEDELRKIFTDMGIPFKKNSDGELTNRTGRLLLLFVTEDDYIILGFGTSAALSIRRDMVKAVFYESEK